MRFKSIFGAFFFVVLASVIALVVFVQTKSFGSLMTRIVSDITQRKTLSEVRIKNLSISVFPPGIELNKVSFKKDISPEEKFEAEFGKIGLYVSLIEIEEKRLTLGEIRISDSHINYTFPKKEKEIKEIDEAVINKFFDMSKNSPLGVNTLILENVKIIANHDLLEARRFKIFKKDESFITRFHLANLRPSAEVDFKLDEVWGDAEISRKDLKIYRLKIQHDVHSLLAKGKIKNYRLLKKSNAQLNGDGSIHLRNIKNIINLPEIIQIEDGFSQVSFHVNYQENAVSGGTSVTVKDYRSNMFHADQVQLSADFRDSKIMLNSFSLKYEDEILELIRPALIANLNEKNYLHRPIFVSAREVSLHNALRILPALKPLTGNLSGNLSFEYKNGDIFLKPSDGFEVKGLGLVVGEERPFKVLMAKQIKLKNSSFSVIKNEFRMESFIEMARSKLEVKGMVNKNEVRFDVPTSQIDLEDLGNIANLDIKGAGPLSLNVSGKLDDVIIGIEGKTKNFEILGYRLGHTDKKISIELGDSSVIIHKMESLNGQTHLSGTGLVNYGSDEIALGINSNDANYHDLTRILHPIFTKVDFLPEDLNLKARIDVNIFGKYRLPELKVKSKIDFSDLTVYGENLNSGSFEVNLLNQVLSFNDFSSTKGQGHIHGDFQYGLKDSNMKVKYSWDNLDLNSFNLVKKLSLNVNSSVSGSFVGLGTPKDYHFKFFSKAFNTKSQSYDYEDSEILMDISDEKISGDANLFGKFFHANVDYYLNPGKKSKVDFKVDASDIRPYIVAVFGQHLEYENLAGRLKFELKTSFYEGLKHLDLVGSLNEMTFSHPEFNVKYASVNPEFVIKNNIIQSWNLNIKEQDFFLSSRGEGKLGGNLSLVHELHFSSKILEILLRPVLSAQGFLRNIVRIDGRDGNYDFSISSKANDLSMSIDGLPVAINQLKYDIEYADRRLQIQNVSMIMDPGSASLKGDVFFIENGVDVNLKFQLDRAEIPILRKSSVNLSGEGIVLGNKVPYNIGGEIIINKGLIVNELNDFSSKSAALSQIRFLPKNQESVFGKLATLNLNVKADNPVRITNSLMDVALKGEVRIFGNPSRPRGEGRLFVPANSSRIFFKNNEYLITNADINLSPKKEISNPDFDIQAMTLISNYKVYPKAYGDLERFNFDLTSDPALSRNSILSLIAFGYSDEIQSTLGENQQQSLNQVGVGSFVFDRFKISDILNKQFGLQVNLGTVFEQSTTDSLLAGRSQEGLSGQGGALGRTRSATKIELKKRLDEELTLSVSSTMGGGIGQRQSMNLNYGLSEKVELEGVYELRTNAEGEEDVIDNSIGADVKFRWTFK